MIRFFIVYAIIGLIFMVFYAIQKDENRVPVLMAVVTGWPIFLFSMIGAGWNSPLSQEEKKET